MERDELVDLIANLPDRRTTFQGHYDTADRIIAAGWRKVPDDCVVVRRKYVEFIVDVIERGAISDYLDLFALRFELRQALADQLTDERGEEE